MLSADQPSAARRSTDTASWVTPSGLSSACLYQGLAPRFCC